MIVLWESGSVLGESQIYDILDMTEQVRMGTEGIREFWNDGVLRGAWSVTHQLLVNVLP